MSLDLISKTRTRALINATAPSSYTANVDGTEVDLGNCTEGLLIVSLDAYTAGTDAIDNFALYSSAVSAFTNGVASDRATLTQNVSDSINAVTITTSEVTAGFSSDGIYVFEAQKLRRFAKVQYDAISIGTPSTKRHKYSVTLVTTNLGEAPYKPATTAY